MMYSSIISESNITKENKVLILLKQPYNESDIFFHAERKLVVDF